MGPKSPETGLQTLKTSPLVEQAQKQANLGACICFEAKMFLEKSRCIVKSDGQNRQIHIFVVSYLILQALYM